MVESNNSEATALLPSISKLLNYFTQIVKEHTDILGLSKTEYTYFSYLPMFSKFFEVFGKRFEKRGYLPDLKLAEQFVKTQLNEEEPIFAPLGFNLENDDHSNFIIKSFNYHFFQELISFFRLFVKAVIPSSLSENILQSILNFNKHFIKLEGSSQEIREAIRKGAKEITREFDITTKIKDFLGETLGFSEPEIYITEYKNSFDIFFSLFLKPAYRKMSDDYPESYKAYVESIKEKVDSKFHKIFDYLDSDLRNAFIHRNYTVDKDAKEIKCFKGDGSKYGEIFWFDPLSFQELKARTMKLKSIVLSLLHASYTHFAKWMEEIAGNVAPYFSLWNIRYVPEGLTEYLGIDFSDAQSSLYFHKNNKEVEKALLELKTLMNMHIMAKSAKLSFFNFEFNENDLEESYKRFWSAILKNDLLRKEHSLLYGYHLALTSDNESFERNILGIETYIAALKENQIVFDEQIVLFEASISLVSKDKSKSVEFFERALETKGNISITDDKKEKIILQIRNIDAKELEVEFLHPSLSVIVLLINLCSKYNLLKFTKHQAILNFGEESVESIINNLPLSVQQLIEVVKKISKPILGSQITKIMRENNSKWPEPDFVKTGDCLRFAAKVGFVEIEEGNDIKVSISSKFVSILNKFDRSKDLN